MANTKIILGIVAGASIGAIAAILLSPAKGSDTRQKIGDAATDWATSVKDCVVDFFTGKKRKAAGANGESMAGNPGMNLNTMG
jgi:gas vesicle protein